MRVTKNEEIISSLFYDRFHTFEEMRKPELRHYHESSVMLEDPVGYLQVQKAFFPSTGLLWLEISRICTSEETLLQIL